MKRLFFLVLGMFTMGSSAFMIAGLLPEIGKTIGQSISITGQGITAFSLTYLISAPVFSMMFSNRSAKQTLKVALFVFILGNVLTLFAENLLLFIIGRVITGLGAGIFNPLVVSIAIELGDPGKKGKTLSLIWGANSAGVVFGVPLGVYISQQFAWQYSIGFVAAFAFIVLLGFSIQRTEIKASTPSSKSERFRLLFDKNVLAVIGVTCFTCLVGTGLYSYISLIHSGSPHALPTILLLWGFGGFIGSSFIGSVVDKTQNPQGVMASLIAGLALTFVILPYLIEIPYVGLVPFFVWGVMGWATVTPQQYVLFELHEKQKALLSALNSSAIGLGASMGTALWAMVIASGVDQKNLPFCGAAVLGVVFLGQILLMQRLKRKGA
ncbi:MFS transporter [Candidatus Uabimicrobium amorphum]|uniref:Chloramphenicol resistance protein n=1 Tax=Uabimicrobium amorphum TaxID=2596890 RepID=A0A5S9IHY5_UABAM|nr:MFS transporter [Candidatus Uabimicrobium amorphum]BBM82123.1 chloramphenicol resistance protein [Candidatus Uabimicrobium amorphum]